MGIHCLTLLKVQDQGVGRTILPLKALGKDLFQISLLASSSYLVCGSIILIFTWQSPSVLISVQISPFIKDTNNIGSGAHLTPV